jgi:hypothetical protein
MSMNKDELVDDIARNLDEKKVAELLPEEYDAEAIFNRTMDSFPEEEAPEVLAEVALTIHAECERDDFHSWNYDHLEFIIELSKEFDFSIPRNLLNGLPEQLIILVESDRVDRDGCR